MAFAFAVFLLFCLHIGADAQPHNTFAPSSAGTVAAQPTTAAPTTAAPTTAAANTTAAQTTTTAQTTTGAPMTAAPTTSIAPPRITTGPATAADNTTAAPVTAAAANTTAAPTTPAQNITAAPITAAPITAAPNTTAAPTTATTPTATTAPTAATTAATTATTPTTTASTTPAPCDDDPQTNCWSRPDENCFGIYEPWARSHCPLRCGFCEGKVPPCVDAIPQCIQFGRDSCVLESYQSWARVNCRKTCNLCAVPGRPDHIPGFYTSSPEDGDVIYACAGDSIYFAWKYILGVDEHMGVLQWFFNSQMIADFSNGTFHIMPLGANKNLEYRLNAGIVMPSVRVQDSGNYSVEIRVNKIGQNVTVLRRRVELLVSADLPTVTHQLTVTLNPEPVFDTAANKWALELQCAFTLSSHSTPNVTVEWVTPRGEVRQSNSFEDNHFNLLIENPVQGGNYICRVHVTGACLRTNDTESSVQVNEIEGRLALLLKENEHISNRLQALENGTPGGRPAVGFYTEGHSETAMKAGTTLVPNITTFNYGGGYNETSGEFKAPVPGLYYFYGSFVPLYKRATYITVCGLYVDDDIISRAGGLTHETAGRSYAFYPEFPSIGGLVQGLVQLDTTQRVWMKNLYVTDPPLSYFNDSLAYSFAGFLVSPHQ